MLGARVIKLATVINTTLLTNGGALEGEGDDGRRKRWGEGSINTRGWGGEERGGDVACDTWQQAHYLNFRRRIHMLLVLCKKKISSSFTPGRKRFFGGEISLCGRFRW